MNAMLSVRIRYFEMTNLLFSLDGIRTHTFDTLQHQCLKPYVQCHRPLGHISCPAHIIR